ncbi:hypothetical protein [Kutzneria chonburiensis]|uniref:Transmembrane protein n=1 Tax=Kutzneria chonburiensis TaxID=1483604 RepID=A0ABV6N1M4_9PSEU|nr:hypothetical protein [Kutzneria chonburiensis]
MTTTEMPQVTAEEPAAQTARSRWNWPVALLVLLAAVPVVSMIVEVLRSPRLNFLDYWSVLGLASTPSGQYHLGGLFVLYNGHPVVIAGTLFWLDAKFFGGSNPALGLLVVVLSLVVVAAMASMLPRRLSAVKRAGLVAGFAFLMFSPGNMENFGEGMSGTHWLSGLAPAIVAIALAHRGRTVLALVVAVIACLGHGAAFPVWAALALIAWLRGDRPWKVVTPIVVAVLGGAVAYWTLPSSGSIPLPTFALDRLLAVVSGTLGMLWSTQIPDQAMLAGALSLIVLVVGIALVVRSRTLRPELRGPADEPVDNAGWTGLSVHILLAAIMIGISRAGLGDTVGESGRYAVISGIAACSVVAMVVLLWRKLAVLPAVVIAVTAGLVTFTMGSEQATNVRNQYPDQTVLAIAAQLDATKSMTGLRMNTSILPVVKGLGAYPFTKDFSLDCGGIELGSKLDVSQAPVLPGGPGHGRSGGYVESGPVVGDAVLGGWAMIDNKGPDCVLVVDDQHNVVGGGAVGIRRGDVAAAMHSSTFETGWHAVAAPQATNPQVVVIAAGKPYRLPVAPKQ